MSFNGLGRNLGNLAWLSEAETRSISAENPTGGKGMGGMADADPNGPVRELGQHLSPRSQGDDPSPGLAQRGALLPRPT